ncbi:peroxide stress protein YaaA [Myxosarcina sp. GI1]|uniref:peroxide stress protein YaaA n=1 Tax=Myxosarcina sp. GI1 TaxID=1541065 RepID=UPI00056A9AC8|nr:peroxide stress protein YaaA [Myxosarcina sp. GI1]
MLLILSPSKTLDFEMPSPTSATSELDFYSQTQKLVKALGKISKQELSNLMGISDKLGKLNAERYQNFSQAATKQAMFAFKGDVYEGLQAINFSDEDITYAQKHLRILSGLYGLLKPLDAIAPYRLEMGTRLSQNPSLSKSLPETLYQFWEDGITEALNRDLQQTKSQIVLNLASQEYAKALNLKILSAKFISPVFKDWKNDKYKVISFYAKKARGIMARYIIQNRITNLAGIKKFTEAGYIYNEELSTEKKPVFTRKL